MAVYTYINHCCPDHSSYMTERKPAVCHGVEQDSNNINIQFLESCCLLRECHKTIQKLATPHNSHHLHQKILPVPSKNKYNKLLLNCCYLFAWFNTLCTCTHNQVVISWRKGWDALLMFAFMNHSCVTQVPPNFPDTLQPAEGAPALLSQSVWIFSSLVNTAILISCHTFESSHLKSKCTARIEWKIRIRHDLQKKKKV